MATENKLPEGIQKTDLKWPSSDDYSVARFELWHVERFGWVIPTLPISGRGDNLRTYAVEIAGGKVVSVGRGPHVHERHEVYVRKSRKEALQKYLDLKTAGEGDAGMIRDRISTRRANTALRRSRLY